MADKQQNNVTTIHRHNLPPEPPDPAWSYDLNQQLERYSNAIQGNGTEVECFVAQEIMTRFADIPVAEPEHELMRRAAHNFFMLCKVIEDKYGRRATN